MSISVSLFRTRFPEFSDDEEYPDLRIQMFIDDSILLYLGSDEVRWNGRYNVAQTYLTAHLLTSATNTEAGDTNSKSGTIASKSAGGVSVNRNVSTKERSDNDEFFISTAYGQQFINIRNITFVGATTVVI